MQMETHTTRRLETVRCVAEDHGTSPDLIMGRSQKLQVRAARRAAMMAMRERFDDPVDTIAAFFGRTRRQVQYSIAAAAGWERDEIDRMAIVQAVAAEHRVSLAQLLRGTGRKPHFVAARRAAIVAVFDAFPDTPAGIAAALGLDQTTVRSHLRATGRDNHPDNLQGAFAPANAGGRDHAI